MIIYNGSNTANAGFMSACSFSLISSLSCSIWWYMILNLRFISAISSCDSTRFFEYLGQRAFHFVEKSFTSWHTSEEKLKLDRGLTGATPVWDPLFHINFGRLVLGCIDSYDSESRRIFQHFSRSTRLTILCTAPISNFKQKICIKFWCYLPACRFSNLLP